MSLRLEMRGYFASVRPECPHALQSAIEHGIDWHGRSLKFGRGPARRERIWFVKNAARAILETGDGLINDPEQPLAVSGHARAAVIRSHGGGRFAIGIDPRNSANSVSRV